MDYDILDPDDAVPGDRTIFIDGVAVDPDSLSWTPVRKRPVLVEAVELDEPGRVETMEGVMEAPSGSVLIRGVEGEVYPCDPAIFAQTYTDADGGDSDHARLTRASNLLDDATAPLDSDEAARKAIQALLDLAEYVGADVVLPGANPRGEASDGGGN